jgi:hypothetical protein
MSRSRSNRHRFVPSFEMMPIRLTPSGGGTAAVAGGAMVPESSQGNPMGSGLVCDNSSMLSMQDKCSC